MIKSYTISLFPKQILLVATFIFFSGTVLSQSKAEIAQMKKQYSGIWVNKQTQRYLSFTFDKEVNYVTINDWEGSWNKNNNSSVDAYKAYIKNGKPILPVENKDHHAPYCEIEIVGKKLIYQCNAVNYFSDSTLPNNSSKDATIFIRFKK